MDRIGLDDLVADLHATADQLDIDLADAVLNEDCSFQSDLGMDSLTVIDFLVYLERRYHVSIADDRLATIDSLGDMLAVLNEVATVP